MSSLKENKLALGLGAATSLAAIGMLASQGCSWDTFVKTNLPVEVQQRLHVPAKVTHRDALALRVKLVDQAEFEAEQWQYLLVSMDAALDESGVAISWFQSLTDLGWSVTQTSVGTTYGPLGSGILALLAGAAGLAFNRPGTTRREAAKAQEHLTEVEVMRRDAS
jgi:hypothetical protein